MRLAFGALGLTPDVFWNMSLREWCCAVDGYRQKQGLKPSTYSKPSRDVVAAKLRQRFALINATKKDCR